MTVRAASAGERQFWAYERLQEDGDATILLGAFELQGELDVATIHAATATLIERHEILRSEFRRIGGDVTIVEHPPVSVRPDVTAVIATDRGQAMVIAEQLATRPIDLERPPLLRVSLVSWASDRHILAMVSHHAVLDGASLGILVGEFGDLIDPRSQPLPPPVSLSVIRAEETARRETSGARDIAYWCDQLAGVPQEPSSPDDGDPSHRADTATRYIDGADADRLRDLAGRLRATPTIVLLTLWSDLLFMQKPSASEMVIGLPVSGRTNPRQQAVVGLLMNTIPLVVPRTEGSLVDRVTATRRVFLKGLQHHRAPLTEVATAARPGQSLEVAPLYWAMFSQGEQSTLSFGGHTVERIPLGGDTTDAPVSFVMVEESSGRIRTSISIEHGFPFGDGDPVPCLDQFHDRLIDVLPDRETTS